MGDYMQGLLYVCFAPFDYGFGTPMLLVSAGSFLLGGAAQCFLLSRRRKIAWLPFLCAAAALIPSVLVYRLAGWIPVSFISQGASDFIVYAAIAAVYSLPGMLLGWLSYLLWRKCRTSA